MRLCILTSSYPNQGGPSASSGPGWLPDFIADLQKRGHQVFVITTQHQGGNLSNNPAPVFWFNSGLRDRNLTDLSSKSFFGLLSILIFLTKGFFFSLRTLRRERPDHILVCWAVPFGLFAVFTKWFLRFPYSVFSLGSDVWNIGNYPFGLQILRLIFRQAEAVLADGFGLAEKIQRISDRKCVFASTVRTLNINDFYKVSKNPRGTKFLFIGRYDYNKGPDLLLKAWKLLVKENQDVYLYMFGAGTLELELKEFIKNNRLESCLHFGGFAKEKDIVSYMRAVDCVVIPSRADSIPMVFSEALQNNRPIVATDVGDTGSLIRKYNLGFVAGKDNPEDLKNKLLEFIGNKNKNYQVGLDRAKKIFKIEETVEIFLREIERK